MARRAPGHARPIAMIRVLRAPLSVLRGRLAIPPLPASSVLVEPPGAFPVPWGGARALLGALRRRLGDEAVERAIAPHHALLSLALRRLDGALSPEDRARRARLGAQPLGFMSHSRMTAGPLLEAWLAALAPLIAGRIEAVALPNVARIDAETLVVLRHLVQRLPAAERPEILLGYDRAEGPVEPLWRRSVELVEAQLSALEALPEAVVEDLPGGAAEPGPERARAPAEAEADPLDDRAEERAYEALLRAPVPPGEAIRAEVVRAARDAFAAFGFTAALRLGLELLARDEALPAPLAAEVHAIVALSAYNRRLEGGDPALTALLERHFSAALDAEADPARRSHLYYRLCINAARRAGDLTRGAALAERALEEAGRPDLPASLAAYLEAWARNGRAYVLARQRRLDEAAVECEAAHAMLLCAAELAEGGGAVAPRELLASRVVFLDNLAEIALRSGDLDRAATWQAALQEAEVGLDSSMRAARYRWVVIRRAQGRVEEALREAEQGLAEARHYLNPVMEDRFALHVGDLRYRIGDAAGAHRAFAAALALRRVIGDPEDVARTEMSCAVAAARAGLLDEAQALLERALDGPLCGRRVRRGAARAEVLAALGKLAARRGDAAGSRRRLNEAIAEAAGAGERDALLRVAAATGQASLALGRRAEAPERPRGPRICSACCWGCARRATATRRSSRARSRSPPPRWTTPRPGGTCRASSPASATPAVRRGSGAARISARPWSR